MTTGRVTNKRLRWLETFYCSEHAINWFVVGTLLYCQSLLYNTWVGSQKCRMATKLVVELLPLFGNKQDNLGSSRLLATFGNADG